MLRFLVALAAILLNTSSQVFSNELAGMLPRPVDRGSLWWQSGFPALFEGVPWRRCIETGHYRLIFNTEQLTIPHIGVAEKDFGELPGAELKMQMVVDGKTYRANGTEPFSRFVGPRLIAAGKFLQRADITGLVFTADDGAILNTEARMETVAWPDRLGFVLAARPGLAAIPAGEAAFGRVNGGFGLDGSNALSLSAEEAHTPAQFTLEFWVYPPTDFKAGANAPWLLCKNAHEAVDGNYGLVVHPDGAFDARFNIGGGTEGAHLLRSSQNLKLNTWNHVALSYDGQHLRLYANGNFRGELAIGKPRVPTPGGLTFGNRQDQPNGSFAFRGVIDEVNIYDHVLPLSALKRLSQHPAKPLANHKPIRSWAFRGDVAASATQPYEKWQQAELSIDLHRGEQHLHAKQPVPPGHTDWQQTAITFDPRTFQPSPLDSPIAVQATEIPSNKLRRVVHDPVLGCHRIDLNGITPTPPPGQKNPSNDALERIRLQLSNPSDHEQTARLLFEKSEHGIAQRIGAPITGISAILRDANGAPTGIPVQLSKNWHVHPKGGVYSGQWFHGISILHLPPKASLQLELNIAYGHWGGLPAASHAQLSLIGWGGNQRWDQSAIGAWGESICYEPEQVQAGSAITDVRPLMVTSTKNRPQWGWTTNVGGGDFFRLLDPAGKHQPAAGMKADYHRYGPCLTEVSYYGFMAEGALQHRETVSLARSNDLVCGTYKIRMDVTKPTPFSRFVIFQVGTDRYNPTKENKMAVGHAGGLIKEWIPEHGGDVYKGEPIPVPQRLPWASLHESEPDPEYGATANRGMIIREWNAVLGGQPATPHFAQRGMNQGNRQNSTLDIVPPPGVTQLLPGDFVEATIQHLIVPQFAADYYGPNAEHRADLEQSQNTWRPVQRQVNGDDIAVEMKAGTLEHLFPDVRINTVNDSAELTLTSGIGHVPITFTGLSSHTGYTLSINGQPLNQSVHGNDFWQTDFDPHTRTWSQTYNIPVGFQSIQQLRFHR